MKESIRRALAEDLQQIDSLEKRCFEDPWSQSALAAELTHPHSLPWILTVDDQLAGYAFFRHLLDEAELLRLAIDPRLRRQGLARQLLSFAMPRLQARGVERCWLEVRADNVAAIALYRACGFSEQGRRLAYYRDGCDALLLQYQLPPTLSL